jgi:hypothetical protein
MNICILKYVYTLFHNLIIHFTDYRICPQVAGELRRCRESFTFAERAIGVAVRLIISSYNFGPSVSVDFFMHLSLAE